MDAGGTNLYFGAQNNSGSSVTYLSAPIAWSTNDWHFIALTYTATNTALYLDAELLTNALGVTVLPPTSVVTNGFFIGSDSTGFEQARGVFDDIYTFGSSLNSTDVVNIYYSQYYDFFLNPYNATPYANESVSYGDGTNLWLNVLSISNNLATLLMADTLPDILYEIQGKTNLTQPNWISESFVYGSEITNWTTASLAAGATGNLFLRTRSWQDSTGTGIPDWWWYQYFNQITNVDASASAAGDGYSNFQKFQMGLNPTNYYYTNPPSGFFGAVAQTTNVFLFWNPNPGPVLNYLVQRGILNTNTGNYAYTSFVLSSNVTQFEDAGVVSNDNAQQNIYNLEALYAGGCVTGTDTWNVSESRLAFYGPPLGPPKASNVWANADATGTNLLISWTSAQGPLTNYIVERGIYNVTNDDYDFYQMAVAATNTNSMVILNEFTNATNWGNIYGVVAAYPGGVLSESALSTIQAGPISGTAAPTGFSGYVDSTGTNAWFTWNLSTNATSYIIYRGSFNTYLQQIGYVQIGTVGAGTNTFESVGGAADAYQLDVYTVVAVYSGGDLSKSADPWQVSGGSAAPTTLSAYVDATGTNVILAWSVAANGVTGYVLSRSDDGGNTYSQLAQVNSNVATYQDTNGAASGVSSLVYEVQASYRGCKSLSVNCLSSLRLDPPGFGCARLATLAFAPPNPGGVEAEGRKTIYRKTFTPPDSGT